MDVKQIRMSLKCQSPDCRNDLAMAHFNGAGSAIWVRCQCGTVSEFKSQPFCIEARAVPKEEVAPVKEVPRMKMPFPRPMK